MSDTCCFHPDCKSGGGVSVSDTNTHTHRRTITDTHTHTITDTYAHTHIVTQRHNQTHTVTHNQTSTQTLKHTHTHTHSCTKTHKLGTAAVVCFCVLWLNILSSRALCSDQNHQDGVGSTGRTFSSHQMFLWVFSRGQNSLNTSRRCIFIFLPQ